MRENRVKMGENAAVALGKTQNDVENPMGKASLEAKMIRFMVTF